MKRNPITRWLACAAFAALLMAPVVSEAARYQHAGPRVAKGRTTAIRAGIAAEVNALNLMHVGNQIQPSQIRFRSKPVREIVWGEAMGIHARDVKWRVVRPGTGTILGGTTRSFTPIPALGDNSGGPQTIVEAPKLTQVPRSVAPAMQHTAQRR